MPSQVSALVWLDLTAAQTMVATDASTSATTKTSQPFHHLVAWETGGSTPYITITVMTK
jgi:hypothetical protein